MDPNRAYQYQHYGGNQQPQEQRDRRFSWQVSVEDVSNPQHAASRMNAPTQPQPQQYPAQQQMYHHSAPNQAAERYSWVNSPAEMQEPQIVWPPVSQQQQQQQPHQQQQQNRPRQASQPTVSPILENPQSPRSFQPQQLPGNPSHAHARAASPGLHIPIAISSPQQVTQEAYRSSIRGSDGFTEAQEVPRQPVSPLPVKEGSHALSNNGPASPGPLPMKPEQLENARGHRPAPIQIKPDHDNGDDEPLDSQRTKRKQTQIFSPDSLVAPDVAPSTALHHQPGQISHPNMNASSVGEKQAWRHSLCGCPAADVSTCLVGIACPCVLHGKTTYRLSARSAKRDPTDLLGWSRINTACLGMSMACGLWWVFPTINRVRIRHAYGLQGNIGKDVAEGCCCCCCVIVQNEREVKSREENTRRWAGPSTQYTAPEMMTY